MGEGAREWLSAWEDFRFEVETYRELENGRVLVLTRFSVRGKTSGIELGRMHAHGAWLFELSACIICFGGPSVLREMHAWRGNQGQSRVTL
jgi:hypothetical protein